VTGAGGATGGRVGDFTREYASPGKAAPLIDGTRGLGWSSQSRDVPQVVTIELGRPAVVRHVVINPYSREHVANAAREAEVLLSETGRPDDFRVAGRLRMEAIGRGHALDLKEPARARVVQVRLLHKGGG